MNLKLTQSAQSAVTGALLFYARFVPYHRGKQRLTEWLVHAFGVSLSGERLARRGGLHWALDPADYVCRDVFWCGAKDAAQLEPVLRIMRSGGVMLDIGASFGYYSVKVAAALAGRCTIHAFEPHPDAFARLSGNLTRNGIRGVHAHAMGLSDGAGTASVVSVADNSGAAYLQAGRDIPVTTVDDFCRVHHVDRLDLIKIDVEGWETRVLRGAARTLETLRPCLLVEVNTDALLRSGSSVTELLDELRLRRYAPRVISRRRENVDLMALDGLVVDVLCVPAERR